MAKKNPLLDDLSKMHLPKVIVVKGSTDGTNTCARSIPYTISQQYQILQQRSTDGTNTCARPIANTVGQRRHHILQQLCNARTDTFRRSIPPRRLPTITTNTTGTLNDSCMAPNNEYRIVLIGKTGSGKSASANTLTGTNYFKSKISGKSVTRECTKLEGCYGTKKIVVVDTPGIFDTCLPKENTTKEILKCIGILAPGPHAVVLVVQIGRVTQEQQDTVHHFVKYFGEPVLKFMIILFTKMDDIIDEGTTLEQYLANVPASFRNLMNQCNHRFVGFNNKAIGKHNEEQLQQFYSTVDRMVRFNGGSCYTNEILRAVEKTLQERMEKRRKLLESQRQKEIDGIKSTMEQRVINGKKLRVQKATGRSYIAEFEVLRLLQQQQRYLQMIEQADFDRRYQKEVLQYERAVEKINICFEHKMKEENLRKEEREDIAKGKGSVLSSIGKGFIKGCKIVGAAVSVIAALVGLFAL